MTATTALPATTTVLQPRGPFTLERTREFVGAWPPLARYAPGAGEPLRLGTVLDGEHTPVALALTQDRPDGPVIVEVAGTTRIEVAARQAARVLSLDHDARGYPDLARRDPSFGQVMARRPGLRPTLFGSPYEAACWSVISARMPAARAAGVLVALADAHGAVLDVAGGRVTCFPDPAALLAVDAVPGLGAEKVRRLHEVAAATLAGRLEADELRGLGAAGARAALQELRGIGPFWSSLIWIRACGVVDDFPDEPRALAALARLHGRDPAGDLTDLTEALAPFRTWAAHLLRVAS